MSELNGHEVKPDQEASYQSGGAISRFITPGGNPMDTSQPAFPVYHRKFGNPAPLGLLAFGGTTFVLSLFNCQARHITVENIIVGLAFGYGGLAQIIAGIEEWACGNTFGATAFTSYGAFWISFGFFFIPQFEVFAAYQKEGVDPGQLNSALGIYLAMWGIITFIFLLGTLRSSVSLFLVFFFLDITFWLLSAGKFTGNIKVTKAGGGVGIATAFTAFYTALAGLLTADTSYFIIPVGDLSK